MTDLTPVQRHGDVWLKRDDLYEPLHDGNRGGKMRTCMHLARVAKAAGRRELVTAGSRHSPQVPMVAAAAAVAGLDVVAYVPAGPETPELALAASLGAKLEQVRPGYNGVIVARARSYARNAPWSFEVPFGMECQAAVDLTSEQVLNLPAGVGRIVVPVGSGMSLAGILTGLWRTNTKVPVLGVWVGADATPRLDRWAPWWRQYSEQVSASHRYQDRVDAQVDGVTLDPVYEAKCVEFLQPGDLLWVVGHRA